MEDLDFRDYTNFNIGSYYGKIEGNDHLLKNIEIYTGDGLINRLYGTLQNIRFENVTKINDTTNSGLIGRSDDVAKLNNIHIKNIRITVPKTRTADSVYASTFVGYMYYSKVTNCSVTNGTIISEAEITDVNAGGIAGYSYGSGINNVFVQNININITKYPQLVLLMLIRLVKYSLMDIDVVVSPVKVQAILKTLILLLI